VFGSGFKIVGGEPLFVTPSHTLDALYVLRLRGAFTVSNSLAFLVRFSGLELPFDFSIGARFTSIREGIGTYAHVVFEGPDWTLYRIVYDNFEIHDGILKLVPKQPTEEAGFDDYASYRTFLERTLHLVARNGAAPGRKVRYPLITTCSSGYDSAACAALAAPLGCREALSLRTARGLQGTDSGRPTAEALGLVLIELDRPRRARGTAFEEAEFSATGMGGEDYVFLGFGPHCRRKILLTGFHGDVVWDRLAPKPADNLQRKDVSGSTLTELRLRHGFVQVPVPFIGATRHQVLLRIANSEEMVPYRVGNRYDRPVPRRIAEEQGIARGTFATAKKAGSIVFDWSPTFWSPHTLRDLREFEKRILLEQGIGPSYHVRGIGEITTALSTQVLAWSSKQLRLARIARPILNRIRSGARYNHPRYDNMAFLWALEKIKRRYPSEGTWRAAEDFGVPVGIRHSLPASKVAG
jgi:hypothetical protein